MATTTYTYDLGRLSDLAGVLSTRCSEHVARMYGGQAPDDTMDLLISIQAHLAQVRTALTEARGREQ